MAGDEPTVKPKAAVYCRRCSEWVPFSHLWTVAGKKRGEIQWLAMYICGFCHCDGCVPWQDESRTWSYQDIYWCMRLDCEPVPG